ncbi:kinase-like domain-containing protein [Aspergillus filifer]
MEKLGEGTYNKAFKLTMANDKTLVARIPNPNAGPDFLTTASEVATMDFLISVLHVPVPKVLAWSSRSGPTSPVGSDYIVMEHAPGTQLAFVWPDMEDKCNKQTIEDIVDIQHKLISVRFSHLDSYGCLYFSEDAPPVSHPAMLSGDDLSHAFKKNVADKFSIRPMVNAKFWNKERAHMNIDRGPWTSALGSIQAPALREISWLEKHADPNPIEELVMPSHNTYPPTEHITVIQRYLPLTPYLLPSEKDIAGAFLCRADMSSANIFVDDDGNITSIIDWQSSAACPLFVGGRPPRFLDYRGEQMLYIYNDYTEERNLLLHKVYSYTGGRLLWDPISIVGSTWDGDVLTLRETLIRVQKHGELFNRPGECPEGWNGIQDMWDSIEHFLDRDGWTSNETYENAESIYDDIKGFQDSQSKGQEKENKTRKAQSGHE